MFFCGAEFFLRFRTICLPKIRAMEKIGEELFNTERRAYLEHKTATEAGAAPQGELKKAGVAKFFRAGENCGGKVRRGENFTFREKFF